MAPEQFIVAADSHGDCIDAGAAEAFFQFCREYKPKYRIHLGDVWDFRWLRAKASEADQWDDHLQDDIDAGVQFLQRFKPTHVLLGNHDWRVKKATEHPKRSLRKLAECVWGDMQDGIGKAKVFPYNKRDGVFRLGNLNLVHGYSAGVGALRKHIFTYGRCMMGHIHTSEQVSVERFGGGCGYSVGCLARLELGYNEQQIGCLRQSNGWAHGVIHPGGRTDVWLTQYEGGSI
jgi:hypothetical protein